VSSRPLLYEGRPQKGNRVRIGGRQSSPAISRFAPLPKGEGLCVRDGLGEKPPPKPPFPASTSPVGAGERLAGGEAIMTKTKTTKGGESHDTAMVGLSTEKR
jgi:hypothetical protein